MEKTKRLVRTGIGIFYVMVLNANCGAVKAEDTPSLETTKKVLSEIEKSCYGEPNTNGLLLERLEKLEVTMFGSKQSGTTRDRIDNLSLSFGGTPSENSSRGFAKVEDQLTALQKVEASNKTFKKNNGISGSDRGFVAVGTGGALPGYSNLAAKLLEVWNIPAVDKTKNCRISFDLQESGMVKNAKVFESSNDAAFDAEALSATTKISSVKRADFRSTETTIVVRFVAYDAQYAEEERYIVRRAKEGKNFKQEPAIENRLVEEWRKDGGFLDLLKIALENLDDVWKKFPNVPDKEVRLGCTVTHSGDIEKVVIKKSSGNPQLDAAFIKALTGLSINVPRRIFTSVDLEFNTDRTSFKKNFDPGPAYY